ncbi:MAG: alpha/beta hydrolase [Ignavibacteria bacterium]|nr:alpha/beta hydrolase [Ignavibacteria bacterium]
MKEMINELLVSLSGRNESNAIVFVHGFPFDHKMWQAQVVEISKDYFCVTYDIRGLGESTVDDGQFTMESFVDDLEKIIDELKLNRPVLCGLSMGGYISLRAIERIQEKFSALILCDTKSSADDNEGKLKRAAAIKLINSGGFESFIDAFVLNCFGEKFVKEKRNEYDAVVNRSMMNNSIGVKGCLLAMVSRTDTTNILNKIKLPTLIICGSEDKLSPPDVMKSMAEQIPNSEFVLVKNTGHMTPIESPQVVNQAIKNFLTKNRI